MKGMIHATCKELVFVNHIKVTIYGTEYRLVSDESPSYTIDLARQVDADLRDLMSANPRLTLPAAAVLTALTYADNARKAELAADNLRDKVKELLDENTRLNTDAQTLQLHF